MSMTEQLSTLSQAEIAEFAGIVAEYDAPQAKAIRAAAKVMRRATHAREVRAAIRAEWECGAYAQYLQAEAELAGNLVRKGSALVSGWSLWTGTAAFAEYHMSADLREFFTRNTRTTPTEYAAMVADAKRADAAAA